MVSKWVISPTHKWGIPWGYNPLILTIDPNFQRDIQVVLKKTSALNKGRKKSHGVFLLFVLHLPALEARRSGVEAPSLVVGFTYAVKAMFGSNEI